ncbi:type II secretion system F family protein [Pendulispora brunnea]|uniref:Type II secretion system F family protein n=1 Tax=Pendulispora brunnea TaxID=2905690 RepID=A0ABZ2KH12_9BACT
MLQYLTSSYPLTFQTTLLRHAVLLVIGVGLMIGVYVIAAAPTRVASRLGLRGLKRQRTLEKSEGWQNVEPFVRWLGVRVSGVISDGTRAKIDEQISLAGDYMGITADEFVAMSILSSIGGFLAGYVLGLVSGVGSVAVIPMGLVGGALPWMQVTGASQERLKTIGRGLPYVIDLMALAMGAGLDFPGAVRQVIEKSSNPDDPLVEEFTLIMQTLTLGRTRKDALLEFAKRAPNETVKEFVAALVQAEERGNPVAEVLQIQAATSRNRRSVRAEELAAKAGVAIVGPLMMVFMCVLGLILAPAMMQITSGAI